MSTANLASVLTQSETALAAVIHQAADRLGDVGLHVGAAMARLEEANHQAIHRLRRAQADARALLADVASFCEVMADGLLAELEAPVIQLPTATPPAPEERDGWTVEQKAALPAQIGRHATLSRPLVPAPLPTVSGPPEDDEADSEGGETDSVDLAATTPEALAALQERILTDLEAAGGTQVPPDEPGTDDPHRAPRRAAAKALEQERGRKKARENKRKR